MEQNYTPLDVNSLYKPNDNLLKTILLVIVTLTVGVLAILFFVIIQKNLRTKQTMLVPSSVPRVQIITPSPTVFLPTSMPPTPTSTVNLSTPSATPVIPTSSQIQKQASSSPTLP